MLRGSCHFINSSWGINTLVLLGMNFKLLLTCLLIAMAVSSPLTFCGKCGYHACQPRPALVFTNTKGMPMEDLLPFADNLIYAYHASHVTLMPLLLQTMMRPPSVPQLFPPQVPDEVHSTSRKMIFLATTMGVLGLQHIRVPHYAPSQKTYQEATVSSSPTVAGLSLFCSSSRYRLLCGRQSYED